MTYDPWCLAMGVPLPVRPDVPGFVESLYWLTRRRPILCRVRNPLQLVTKCSYRAGHTGEHTWVG